uniref:Peptidase S1 domain-containing protein n=1 Tax=Anopheles maculatus TaxID=74869 RepID=A0A182SKT2_9DIPT
CRIRFSSTLLQYILVTETTSNSRIPVKLEELAHVAAIGWTDHNTTRWLCSGALIWENFILTAAHCAADENNVPPDVARMGDFDIYDDDDDDFVQELKIVDIIRHPKHRFGSTYYDIALMKLEKNVTVDGTVAPTCLWLENEIRFPKLLMAGWGKTGTGDDQLNIAKKVELNRIANDECSSYYVAINDKLENGLMDHQLCASNGKIGTCTENFAGPLFVKLFEDLRLIPFLVGVMSFGKVCDASKPSVYVKVSSFGDWIIETLQRHGELATRFKFVPLVCAKRHYNVREFKEDLRNREDRYETIYWDRKYMSPKGSDYSISFGWPYSTAVNLATQYVWSAFGNDRPNNVLWQNSIIKP